MQLSDQVFRTNLDLVLKRSRLSMRGLSAAMGRDPGYVAALLDPARPSRARPTPADLLRVSDATGIPMVELLEELWGIDPSRLAIELGSLGAGSSTAGPFAVLTSLERSSLADYAAFLAARHQESGPRVRSR